MPMPDASYFRSRAGAYCRMAIDAKDRKLSNDLFEIAAIFSFIADASDAPRLTHATTERFGAMRFIARIWNRWINH